MKTRVSLKYFEDDCRFVRIIRCKCDNILSHQMLLFPQSFCNHVAIEFGTHPPYDNKLKVVKFQQYSLNILKGIKIKLGNFLSMLDLLEWEIPLASIFS